MESIHPPGMDPILIPGSLQLMFAKDHSLRPWRFQTHACISTLPRSQANKLLHIKKESRRASIHQQRSIR